jgi:hypothetical protein
MEDETAEEARQDDETTEEVQPEPAGDDDDYIWAPHGDDEDDHAVRFGEIEVQPTNSSAIDVESLFARTAYGSIWVDGHRRSSRFEGNTESVPLLGSVFVNGLRRSARFLPN